MSVVQEDDALSELLLVSVDCQFLVGKWCLEEEAGDVANDEHYKVAIDAEHVCRVGEVPCAEVNEDMLAVAHVERCGGKDGVGSEEYGGSDADDEPLVVGTTREQAENKHADDAGREDGIDGKEGTKKALSAPLQIEGGNVDGSDANYEHGYLAHTKLLAVGGVLLNTSIVVFHDDCRDAVHVGVNAGDAAGNECRHDESGDADRHLCFDELRKDLVVCDVCGE